MVSYINSREYAECMSRPASADNCGLEIGPLHHPFVKKDSTGKNIYYTDYRSSEELREANKDNPEVDVNDIVDIDFVWNPTKSLRECIPQDMMFDYVAASQVVEHVPDTIGWIRQLFSVVKVNGVLSLGVPDCRYTFDAYRNTTTVAELLEAYIREEKIPTVRQIYDNISLAIDDSREEVIDTSVPFAERKKLYTLKNALDFAEYSYFHEEYLDAHCTVWTPESFAAVFNELNEIGLLNCKVEVVPVKDTGSFVAYITKTADMELRTLPESRERKLQNECAHLHKAYEEAVNIQKKLSTELQESKSATQLREENEHLRKAYKEAVDLQQAMKKEIKRLKEELGEDDDEEEEDE